MRLLVSVLGTLLLAASSMSFEVAATSGVLPCEVAVGTGLPAPPRNLRIVLDGSALLDASGSVTPQAFEWTPSKGAHEYYETLAARPDCLRAYSLRDAAQLDYRKNGGFAVNNSKPLYVSYGPASDPDARRQDAAKIVIPDFTNNLPNQVRLPIPPHAPESLFVTWEAWFGAEWHTVTSGLDTHKTWQLGSPANSIHTEVRTRYKMAHAPSDIAMTDVRQYGLNLHWGPNTAEAGTFGNYNYGGALGPMAGEFMVQAETWTRYAAFFEAPDADGWYRFSLWVSDERRDPVQILERLQIKPADNSPGGWADFWLEFNTSKTDVLAGRPELVAYARNVVMLKGVTDAKPLLQKPIR